MLCDLQKANMWKRISAYIFDIIILCIAIVGIAFFLSSVLNYDRYSVKIDEAYESYEQRFGVDFDITEAEYNALSEEELTKYNTAIESLTADNEVGHAYTMLVNLTLVIITFSVLLGYIILEFIIPLILKNGQTLGKKIFGVAVMRTDGVKINTVTLFIRVILGKYTIETMIPSLIFVMIYFNAIGILGAVILGSILILQIALLIATRNNSVIHDLISNTVTVDIASQMIFDTAEEMIEYKKKLHLEKVNQTEA